ncbi:hypothetical protein O6P43_007597 [Quillaja saponaria]|uniref:Uncharacterized protein n=1 Tax=Quillaja saponaria TaxID=32244 RepID=A0AAD7VJP3_QUISA|nr:hypothetical protein O6P43_007597 [Quillaja saponaria]
MASLVMTADGINASCCCRPGPSLNNWLTSVTKKQDLKKYFMSSKNWPALLFIPTPHPFFPLHPCLSGLAEDRAKHNKRQHLLVHSELSILDGN